VQGFTGATGVQGALGPQGAQGRRGIQGAQGIAGRTGAPGVQGATGATGPKGSPGLASVNFRSFGGAVGAVANDGAVSGDEVLCADSSASCATGCGPFCSDNARCTEASLGDPASLEILSAPAMIGLSCELSVSAPAGALVQVSAGWPGQNVACNIVHTFQGSGLSFPLVQTKSSFCDVDFGTIANDGFPITLAPSVSVDVLNAIGACDDVQDIPQDFDSEALAAAFGWTSRFYVNDRTQPINTQFVHQNPEIVLDPLSPSAIQVRYWECSSFYYADTTLGMSLLGDARDESDFGVGNSTAVDLGTTNTDVYEFGFSFAVPAQPEAAFQDASRDDGSLFIGYFHKENEFESSVWYVSEYLGVRLYLPSQCGLNGTSCDPFLKLAVETEGRGESTSDHYRALLRGARYRFEGVYDPANLTYTGEVFPIADDGTWDDSVGFYQQTEPSNADSVAKDDLWALEMVLTVPGELGTDIDEEDFAGVFEYRKRQAVATPEPWEPTTPSPPTPPPAVAGGPFRISVNAFGVFHQDWQEDTSYNVDDDTEGLVGGAGQPDIDFNPVEGAARDIPDGTQQTCYNTAFHAARDGVVDSYMVGEAAVADLILDAVHYTIPATVGYPRAGDVTVDATCSGETFKHGQKLGNLIF